MRLEEIAAKLESAVIWLERTCKHPNQCDGMSEALAELRRHAETERRVEVYLDANPMGSVRISRAGSKGDAGPCVTLHPDEDDEPELTEFGNTTAEALSAALGEVRREA